MWHSVNRRKFQMAACTRPLSPVSVVVLCTFYPPNKLNSTRPDSSQSLFNFVPQEKKSRHQSSFSSQTERQQLRLLKGIRSASTAPSFNEPGFTFFCSFSERLLHFGGASHVGNRKLVKKTHLSFHFLAIHTFHTEIFEISFTFV